MSSSIYSLCQCQWWNRIYSVIPDIVLPNFRNFKTAVKCVNLVFNRTVQINADLRSRENKEVICHEELTKAVTSFSSVVSAVIYHVMWIKLIHKHVNKQWSHYFFSKIATTASNRYFTAIKFLIAISCFQSGFGGHGVRSSCVFQWRVAAFWSVTSLRGNRPAHVINLAQYLVSWYLAVICCK